VDFLLFAVVFNGKILHHVFLRMVRCFFLIYSVLAY